MVKKLVGDHTGKNRPNTAQITDSQFADNAAVYATRRVAFKQATTE